MTSRSRLITLAASAALVLGGLAVSGSPVASAVAADPQAQAKARITADTSGGDLTLRGEGGGYDFLGVPAGVELDNPAVTPSAGVAEAAAAHLARYGAAFGTSRPGTSFVQKSIAPAVAGDVVRYQQRVDGVPVLGGEIVMTLRADRELSSVLGRTSTTTKLPAGTEPETDAAATATRAFLKRLGGTGEPKVSALGRWVLDAGLIGGAPSLGSRTVWRFELQRGPSERRTVLVDDRTGGILMDRDLIAHAKHRTVCDNNNVQQNPNVPNAPCLSSTPPVRTEGGPPAALAEANTAYDLAGAVYDGYLAFGNVDLTNLIGADIGGGVKSLAQTVRWCYTGSTCPYANAFWNGTQMYYGQGYAVADDVVAHEMTHGVTERTSNLFYWSQSGAINESLSDIMGEIIDHRNVSPPGESATNWAMGEDLPGFPSGIRNMQDPTIFGDPDRTGSPNYVRENCCSYPDGDGVHSNSGVGNKTFYMISQGGTFNSQTITGIDTGDADLTKSAKLWLLVDQSLSSGSDYADLAAVLDQSCQALLAAGTPGYTAATCTAVHQGTLATELTTTPTNNPQPADAPDTCASGFKRVLFNSETGGSATKLVPGSVWSRDGVPGWGQVAHSNPAAWGGDDIASIGASPLVAARGIAIPAGQPSFLHFHHWRLLDYDTVSGGSFYDAGTVEVDDTGDAAAPVDTAPMTWVNGPAQTIRTGFGNPAAGRLGFGGDSRGYVASRLDLASFAGKTIRPQFTLNTDNSVSYLGWWVDDITVYTCDAAATIGADEPPVVSGTPVVDGTVTATTGTWFEPGVTFGYQWLRAGAPIGGATASTYHPTAADLGVPLSVRVTASKGGFVDGTSTSDPTGPVQAAAMSAGAPKIKGKAKVGKKLTALPGVWGPAPVTLTYQWLRNGKVISGATTSTYKLKSKDRGKKISVRVTGSKPGYTGASATSPPTKKVKPR